MTDVLRSISAIRRAMTGAPGTSKSPERDFDGTGSTRKRMSAVEICREALGRVERLNGRLNAFLEVFPEEALAQARRVDEGIAAGRAPGALAGVPMGVKDNICLSYGKTTCGCRMLAEYRSPYTATAAQRLIDAGAVIIGKTNCDEFAMGSSGEHSAFGVTRNPWDESRVPGGSSAGSASAVAAGMVTAALGSDTGGSIRQPAGWCGIVGMKPTYGRVSRYGLVAYASSLDQIGPMANRVEDCAAILQVISGMDSRDATSLDEGVGDLRGELESPLKGLVVGVPRQARSGADHEGVTGALERAERVLRDAGATVREIELAHADHGIAAYYVIAMAEASSNLARFDGVRYGARAEGKDLLGLYCRSRAEGLGAEVQRRIMLGTHVLSSGYADQYYVTALKARRLITGDFDAAFASGCDAVLMPSSPGPAFVIGERDRDPLAMYLEDVYTVGVNLAGLPGITVPAGFVEEGGKRLPVGVQLVGPALGEARLLRGARMLERGLDMGDMRAPCG